MSRSRQKNKGRRDTGPFMALPHVVTDHPDYTSLAPRAVKALIDLGRQFNGYNNGDLALTWKMAHDRGWTSHDQYNKAMNELIDNNIILKTRQGGKNRCNLFALTWHPIDDCKGKLDCLPTITPPRKWSLEKYVAREEGQCNPAGGSIGVAKHKSDESVARPAGQSRAFR